MASRHSGQGSSMRLVRWIVGLAVMAAAVASPAAAQTAESPDDVAPAEQPDAVVSYRVAVHPGVRAVGWSFPFVVAETLDDPRGWGGDGSLAFVRVTRGGDLTIRLVPPHRVAAAHPVCDERYSCRVGDEVLVNARRWRAGAASYADRPLGDYRRYVVNHEVGHWLGLDHPVCPGTGEQAPVMLQQSKGLDGCASNVWPLPGERTRALEAVSARASG